MSIGYPVAALNMAPLEHARRAVSALEWEVFLSSQEKSHPRAGVGGGFKMHQGSRRAEQPSEPWVAKSFTLSSPRQPLYPEASVRKSNSIESIMTQRAARRKSPTKHPEEPYPPAILQMLPRPRPLESEPWLNPTHIDTLADIDRIHREMQQQQQQQQQQQLPSRGLVPSVSLTTTLLERIGDKTRATAIDYSALRVEAQRQARYRASIAPRRRR